MPKNKLVIIDGNAIIHRAYHAIPPLTNKEGKMMNAVYGFASMLLKVWHDLAPTHIAVTFDMAGPTFRHEKFKEYKATRVKADQELYDQIPAVHDLVRAFNIPIYEKQGYEADDVIGTITHFICHPEFNRCHPELVSGSFSQPTSENKHILKQVQDDNMVIFIVTGDMDTLQLVNDNVKVYTLRKGMSDVVVYDNEEVKKRFGFGPEMVVDYKALRGDASDNIPGVPGIGEKTATELIKEIGGVKKIYEEISKQKIVNSNKFSKSVISKLVAGKESAEISRELAIIDCNVPDLNFSLEACLAKDFDREKVVEMFHNFGFVSLLKRIPGVENVKMLESNSQYPTSNIKALKNKLINKFKFTEIGGLSEVETMREKILKEKRFACQAVIKENDLLGLIFIVGDEGYSIKQNFVDNILSILKERDVEMVGHDLKQMFKIFNHAYLPTGQAGRQAGNKYPTPKGFLGISNQLFDTMVASYLLNPGSRTHDAASIIFKTLFIQLPEESKQNSLFGPDIKSLAQELYYIYLASKELKEELVKINNFELFKKIEMPLIPILAEIETNGVAVDIAKLKELSGKINAEINHLTKSIHQHAGQVFNIASPLQLREILFDKLAIPVAGIKKGKTGLSTSAEQLEKLRDQHPIIVDIENYRELTKLQNTYVDVLPRLINSNSGRIHTTFNQTVTATGRLSSSDPNLQNIPIRTEIGREIRKAFVAAPGNILLSADYSQIELRVVASLAKDEKLLDIFSKNEDVHKATAAAINDIPLGKVTKEMRRAAKAINFGILYGMGAYGLSWRAEINQWQAKEFIEKYFFEFAGVKKYLDQTIAFAREKGYCETMFGRRRYLPELIAKNFQIRSAAERMAVNHPVQGTAADLMKKAMIDVSVKIKNFQPRGRGPDNNVGKSEKFSDDVKIILQVHDELVFEVKKEMVKEAQVVIKEAMENVAKLQVPIVVDIKVGDNWGEMTPVE